MEGKHEEQVCISCNEVISWSNTRTSEGWAEVQISGMCEKIDFQIQVNGMGDLMIEFPMYDFLPEFVHFGLHGLRFAVFPVDADDQEEH